MPTPKLDQVIKHLRNRDYMSGVERDRNRVKATGEVFTPTALVQEILDQLPIEQFQDYSKTFLDPTCGDGQFLSEVIIKKIENGSSYSLALKTTYGADLMPDNCLECIRRLYMCTDADITTLDQAQLAKLDPDYYWAPGLKEVYYITSEHYSGIAKIVCADGLVYDFGFGEEPVFTAPAPKTKKSAVAQFEFLFE
jgi:hypothetical protein